MKKLFLMEPVHIDDLLDKVDPELVHAYGEKVLKDKDAIRKLNVQARKFRYKAFNIGFALSAVALICLVTAAPLLTSKFLEYCVLMFAIFLSVFGILVVYVPSRDKKIAKIRDELEKFEKSVRDLDPTLYMVKRFNYESVRQVLVTYASAIIRDEERFKNLCKMENLMLQDILFVGNLIMKVEEKYRQVVETAHNRFGILYARKNIFASAEKHTT